MEASWGRGGGGGDEERDGENGKIQELSGMEEPLEGVLGYGGGEETRVTPEFQLEQLVEEEQPGGEGGAR